MQNHNARGVHLPLQYMGVFLAILVINSVWFLHSRLGVIWLRLKEEATFSSLSKIKLHKNPSQIMLSVI